MVTYRSVKYMQLSSVIMGLILVPENRVLRLPWRGIRMSSILGDRNTSVCRVNDEGRD